jgi:hypothetical protein
MLRVVASLVSGDAGPVARLGSGPRFRESLADAAEGLFGRAEVLALELNLPQPQLQLRQEIICGKEALDPMPLDAVGVEDDLRGRPLRVESIEDRLLILDVRVEGDELRRDALRDLGVRVDLGFQPSATRSHGGGTEVEEDRLARGPRLLQRRVDVLQPRNLSHRQPPR